MLRKLHLLLSLGLLGALPLSQACTITTTPSPTSECTDSTECPGVACSDGSTAHLCDDVQHVCVTTAAEVCPAATQCTTATECPAVTCPDGTTQGECSAAGVCITDPNEVCGTTTQCTTAAGVGIGGSHCDTDLASAPTDTCSIGGQTTQTYTYSSCVAAHAVFNPGPWEEYLGCLAGVAQADGCSADATAACTAQVHTDACDNAKADDACQSVKSVCDSVSQPFDQALCERDLMPYNDTSITQIIDCMNSSDTNGGCAPQACTEVTCQDAYAYCVYYVAQAAL
jgi:hypothetical protein